MTDTYHHIPEDGDAASRQRQAQDRLGHSDGLEAELAAETEGTITHEGHGYDWPVYITTLVDMAYSHLTVSHCT